MRLFAGFTLWVAYLVLNRKALAWAACAVLLGIAALGLTMFLRWIRCTADQQTRSARPALSTPCTRSRPRGTSR